MDDPTAAINAARAHRDLAERAKAFGEILAWWPKKASEIRAERQAVIQQMHAAGMSWAEIGEAIGQHRTRASQIGRGVTGGKGYKRKTPAPDQADD